LSSSLIVVFGNFGNGNLGDEAALQALIEQLRCRLPGLELVAFAMNVADTEARHGIRAEPATRLAARATPLISQRPARRDRVREALERAPVLFRLVRGLLYMLRSLARVLLDPLFELRRLRTLRHADFLVFGGGGQLSEHVSVFSDLPFPVLKMTLLARLAGARVLILNVGAGPLKRRTSRLLVRAALRLADFRALRDEPSRALVERIGAPTPLHVYPDLAYGLEGLAHSPEQPASRRVVGVNVYPHYDGRYLPAAGSRYSDYLERMSSLTMWLLERGYTVALFPTQLRADPPALADLKARLAGKPGWQSLATQVIEPEIATVDDLLRVLRSTEIVVATRYHAIVLSLGSGRPVLALSNHSKMDQSMIRMGQEAFLFQADDADPETLIEAFGRLEASRSAISAELEERAAAQRALLEREFDQLFGQPRTGLVAADLLAGAPAPRG
jgi:polysaccharide pyruvyl transferase WcaK-like protein